MIHRTISTSQQHRSFTASLRRVSGIGSQTVAKLLGLPELHWNVSFEFVNFDGGVSCTNVRNVPRYDSTSMQRLEANMKIDHLPVRQSIFVWLQR